MWTLFTDQQDEQTGADVPRLARVKVVRRHERIRVEPPDTQAVVDLITPRGDGLLEATASTVHLGEGYGLRHPYRHRGEEFGLVLKGRYEVTVLGRVYVPASCLTAPVRWDAVRYKLSG